MDPISQDQIDPSVPNRAARRAKKVRAALGATGLAGGSAAAVVGLLASPAGALTTHTVNQGGDAGDNTCDATCTLRDAILAANADADASEIVFDASVTGSIVLTQGSLQVTEDFDATVTGPGAGTLTVDGNNNDRVFYATDSFQNSTLSISGLTITRGLTTGGEIKGGGIFMYGDGGDASLVLNNMVITGNVAAYYGGGVAFYGDDNMTITNSRIADNHTLYFDGGGIHFQDGILLTITSSEISGNRAGIETGGSGGGLFMEDGDAVIANSTFANNSAGGPNGNGGGIAVESNNITLLQTTISGNTAVDLGDGLYLASPFDNLAAADKTVPRPATKEDPKPAAAADVGAQDVGTVTVTGTIISANPGTDIDTGGTGATVLSTNNLIGTIGATILINNLGGTIISSTPGLGALANNGGFTQTMALLPGSAAINTGPDPVPAFAGNEFDQRGPGFARVVNGRVDIGAYEVQAIVIEPTFTG